MTDHLRDPASTPGIGAAFQRSFADAFDAWRASVVSFADFATAIAKLSPTLTFKHDAERDHLASVLLAIAEDTKRCHAHMWSALQHIALQDETLSTAVVELLVREACALD